MTDTDKPLQFVGSSKEDLSGFPLEVKRGVGFALRAAQKGGKHPDAKPLTGTVKFKGAIYVLHAFQKKSKTGIRTPQAEIDKIKSRLKRATELYAESDYEKQNQIDQEQRQRLRGPRPAKRR
jgi:phage-related protein